MNQNNSDLKKKQNHRLKYPSIKRFSQAKTKVGEKWYQSIDLHSVLKTLFFSSSTFTEPS
jgi:hypothetical protein